MMRRSRFSHRVAAGMIALALGLAGVALTASPASAATIEVTSSADSGPGTLRQAILDANGTVGGDTITFQPGLGTITLGSGITITRPLTITGPGPDALTITRSILLDMFTVEMIEAGDLTISGINFVGHAAGIGRAIVVNATDPSLGSLTLTNTRFRDLNRYFEGGAVAVYAASGDVVVTDSEFANGFSVTSGGAIYVGTIGGSLLVSNSAFRNLGAPDGGSIYANDVEAIVVQGSTFDGNTASSAGGAIFVGGIAAASGIRSSTFWGNSAGADGNPSSLGGAIYLSLIPADVQFDISQTFISNSTLAEGTSQSMGAGVFVDQTDGVLLVDSTTFAGGRFTTGTGSSAGLGLSIALCDVADTGVVSVINSTFDESSVTENSAIHACTNAGLIEISYSTFVVPGALYIVNNIGNAQIYSTILDATTNTYAVATGDGSPVLTAWNLFSTTTIPAFTTSSGGDRYLVTNPGLGPLELNGGPTPTRLPLVGGAAYDSGDPNAAALAPPLWDQRGSGFPRIDGRIDVGAVEIPRVLPATGQPINGATGLASILLIVAGLGLVAQARRAVVRDRSRQST